MLQRLADWLDASRNRAWAVVAACLVAFAALTLVSVALYPGEADPAWIIVAHVATGFLGGFSLARATK